MGYMLKPETIRHMWPKAPQAKIDAICEIAPDTFDEYGIGDNVVAVAQLMANISHECGGGTIIRESGHYRPDRLVEVFGKPHSSAGVTHEEAQYLVHDEQALFERVYNLPHSPKLAHELGNHMPGDGYKYRGGGDLQLTGRGCYERIGHMTGHPEIIENPDLLEDPKVSFRVAVAEFCTIPGCLAAAKKGNTELVRTKVNGGTNGMSEVRVWVRGWEQALPEIEDPAWHPRGSDSGQNKLSQSNIVKGAVTTGVATGGGVLAQLGTTMDQVNNTVVTAQSTVDSGTAVIEGGKVVVHAIKPFLGLVPEVWIGIGLTCAVVTLVGVGFIIYERIRLHRDKGV